MAKWRWVDRLAQFWDNTVGKVVPKFKLRKWADMSIDNAPVAGLAGKLAGGTLRVDTWQASMRSEIKGEVIRQYLAGRGGLEKMTPADWGSVGGMIADQYRYLDGFAREVAAGNLTEAQIAKRSEMYVNSAREARERAYERAAAEAGLDEVRWVLDPGAEHCTGSPGCLELSQLGWQPAASDPFGGRYPGDGRTPCLTSCRCHTERR